MFRSSFFRALQHLACLFAVLWAGGPAALAQDPAAMPMPAQPGPPPAASATWLISGTGGMPWQVGAMFTGFWVLTAAEIAIISKSANRLDKPKKKDSDLQAD